MGLPQSLETPQGSVTAYAYTLDARPAQLTLSPDGDPAHATASLTYTYDSRSKEEAVTAKLHPYWTLNCIKLDTPLQGSWMANCIQTGRFRSRIQMECPPSCNSPRKGHPR